MSIVFMNRNQIHTYSPHLRLSFWSSTARRRLTHSSVAVPGAFYAVLLTFTRPC